MILLILWNLVRDFHRIDLHGKSHPRLHLGGSWSPETTNQNLPALAAASSLRFFKLPCLHGAAAHCCSLLLRSLLLLLLTRQRTRCSSRWADQRSRTRGHCAVWQRWSRTRHSLQRICFSTSGRTTLKPVRTTRTSDGMNQPVAHPCAHP